MVIIVALMSCIHALALTAALSPSHFYGRWMVGGVFLFFAWLGNMLGQTRRNFRIGIRTPWTWRAMPCGSRPIGLARGFSWP